MFTVCPKCALTLVVTAADLRVAQGYVRCGRCSNVFNALAGLTDERQPSGPAGETAAVPAATVEPAETRAAAAAPRPPAPETVTVAAAGSLGDEPIPEDALEFDPTKTDVAAVFVEPPPNPQWTAATGSFKALIAANQEPPRPADSDAAVDVEIDAAFLVSLIQHEAANAEVPRAAEAAVRPATRERSVLLPQQAQATLSPAAPANPEQDADAED